RRLAAGSRPRLALTGITLPSPLKRLRLTRFRCLTLIGDDRPSNRRHLRTLLSLLGLAPVHLKFSLLDTGSRSASGSNCRMSPGWHESAPQIASSVEKRIARALPVFRIERLVSV